MRGPFRFIHNPPKNAAKPSTKMLMVNVSVTSEILHPSCFDNGTRKTLQAYTAPRAIWRNIPAIAMVQRLGVFIAFPLIHNKHVLSRQFAFDKFLSPALLGQRRNKPSCLRN